MCETLSNHLTGNSEALPETRQNFSAASAGGNRYWYAAYTKPCHEKRVAHHLQIREVELFMPVYRSKRSWRNGCHVTLEKPLFPGYVFVRIPAGERVQVLQLSGVVSIIGNGRAPIPIPDEEISRLRAGLPLVNAEPHPVLTIGEMARICRGPLQGMIGIIIREKKNLRVVLTLDLIMKSIAVEVSVYDVEPIRQAPAANSKPTRFAAAP